MGNLLRPPRRRAPASGWPTVRPGPTRMVTEFYETGRSWGLQWLADSLFKDAFLQRARRMHAGEKLPGRCWISRGASHDPRAAFLLGCASSGSRNSATVPSRREMPRQCGEEQIIQEILDVTNLISSGRFRGGRRRHVRLQVELRSCTSDADAIKRALEVRNLLTRRRRTRKMGTATPARDDRG